MIRREFITLLGGAATAWPLAAHAQPVERVRRIGVLMGVANDSEGQARVAVFRKALQVLGWTEGRNIQFDYRWGADDVAQARRFAGELLALRPDAIFTTSTPVTVAVSQTTRTTPTVFVQVSDPLAEGLVRSLARPDGNLTGFTTFEPSMGGKWLELLKNVAPNITRVAYLFNPDTAPALFAKPIDAAAPLLSIESVAAPVHSANEIEHAIEQSARQANSALLVLPDLFTSTHRQLIISLAARHRLPALYTFKFFARDGGLMSYGIEVLDTYRLAASYIDRILRGAKPADLPVQQPTKFEFVINLKTAKSLGIKFSDNLLTLADEVIE